MQVSNKRIPKKILVCYAIISLLMGLLSDSESGNKVSRNYFRRHLGFLFTPYSLYHRFINNEVDGKHQVIYLHLRTKVSYCAIIWWKYQTRVFKNVDHTQYKWVLSDVL